MLVPRDLREQGASRGAPVAAVVNSLDDTVMLSDGEGSAPSHPAPTLSFQWVEPQSDSTRLRQIHWRRSR